jgi:hypothetical protein
MPSIFFYLALVLRLDTTADMLLAAGNKSIILLIMVSKEEIQTTIASFWNNNVAK